MTGDITPFTQVWVFIVGPLAGAVLAAIIYMLLTSEKKSGAEAVIAESEADAEEAVAETSEIEAE